MIMFGKSPRRHGNPFNVISHPTVRKPATHRRFQNIGMEDDALMPACDARHQQSDDS